MSLDAPTPLGKRVSELTQAECYLLGERATQTGHAYMKLGAGEPLTEADRQLIVEDQDFQSALWRWLLLEPTPPAR
jgi:hypothetical protein